MSETTESITISTFDVREVSVPALVAAVAAEGAKLARKIPGVVVATAAGEPVDSLWCAEHRAWANAGQGVCVVIRSATERELERMGTTRCYIAPARRVTVEITATGLPMWNGWGVAGVLTRNAQGVVIATTVGQGTESFAAEHAHLAGECDHCHKIRNRSATVLLINSATGEVRPVGKTCLGDYTGATIRHEALAVLTGLAERFNVACGNVIDREPYSAPTVDVVALAARYIALDGRFVPSSEAGMVNPTAHSVRRALTHVDGPTPPIMAWDLTDDDRAAAREAIAAVLADESTSEYAFNLRAAASAEWAQVMGKGNTIGLLASLPGAAQRAREFAARKAAREAEREAREARRVDAWIGAEGQRREFTGTIVSARVIDTEWGTSNLVIIDTAEGTVKIFGKVTWPTDGDVAGKSVRLTGTIARHEEWQGSKQTKISRVKVAEVV